MHYIGDLNASLGIFRIQSGGKSDTLVWDPGSK